MNFKEISQFYASELNNKQLDSITFVMDYIQISVNGPVLTAYTLPIVKLGKELYSIDIPGYRDALCKLIGERVQSFIVEENNIMKIKFSDQMELSISLKEDDYIGPEAVMINLNNESKDWNIW